MQPIKNVSPLTQMVDFLEELYPEGHIVVGEITGMSTDDVREFNRLIEYRLPAEGEVPLIGGAVKISNSLLNKAIDVHNTVVQLTRDLNSELIKVFEDMPSSVVSSELMELITTSLDLDVVNEYEAAHPGSIRNAIGRALAEDADPCTIKDFEEDADMAHKWALDLFDKAKRYLPTL